MKIANFLTTKAFDMSMIALILFYTIIVLIFLSFDSKFYEENREFELSFQIIEIIILFIFWLDIATRIYVFRMQYLRDKMNLSDICSLIFAIIFMILDLSIENYTASTVFRIRGVFRMFRIVIIFLQLDELKGSKTTNKKHQIDYSDYKSPLERTMEILSHLRDSIEDPKYIKDLNFCIKHISNGKLYELEVNEPERLGLDSLRRSRRGGILAMEENLWIRSCSSVSISKKLSRMSSMIVILNRKSSALQSRMNITQKAKEMLEYVDTLDFNIFDFKEEMKESELV